ncbi:hypothetical protein BAE44_0017595 [Dichanthelium oligosanthes]|uniref:Uncharacterized protein n=1 Tax=Dichanthelium oligosanthes TaxID=888268 RepID=A0A1E5V897_9POAL|nr:hypothetical protein BAE44_0017595 [Dichanthelium oligosanthes]
MGSSMPIMAFLPAPQVVRTSVLSQRWKDFHSFGDYGWEIGRKNITLHRQGGKTFQCQKLKLIEVIYDYDHDHQLIELVWSLGRSLPDASIKLRKIDMVST